MSTQLFFYFPTDTRNLKLTPQQANEFGFEQQEHAQAG
jgi:hypothetical protein